MRVLAPWKGHGGGWYAAMNNIGDVLMNEYSLDLGRLFLTLRDGEALMCLAPPPPGPRTKTSGHVKRSKAEGLLHCRLVKW